MLWCFLSVANDVKVLVYMILVSFLLMFHLSCIKYCAGTLQIVAVLIRYKDPYILPKKYNLAAKAILELLNRVVKDSNSFYLHLVR